MIDCHVHSDFSSDSRAKPEEQIAAAIAKGVTYLAITDHLDLSKTGSVPEQMRDLSVYYKTLSNLKERFSDQITLAVGIELGWSKTGEQVIADMIAPFPFDYIINSVHDVNGEDVYKPRYFSVRDKQKAFADYFNAVYESLDAAFPYDAIGHLCYPERVAPYDDPAADYAQFPAELDCVLKKLIAKNKILELNTSTAKLPVPCLPRAGVLKRYRDLGGTFICPASDAHDTGRICDKYQIISDLCQKIGFEGFTYLKNRQMVLKKF